jgi:hypothetical protein
MNAEYSNCAYAHLRVANAPAHHAAAIAREILTALTVAQETAIHHASAISIQRPFSRRSQGVS